ncbi:mitotic-spindle organizing protein 1A-like [Ananas comosus]|uniref:Mitotic-spindle organizing protein 1A-like n=1 Tax=Ananas comosus TaxID=4615 RepID=A0A6P5F3R7_ANACO|nr:mitotic-spindle organizing protein 1A-like [Ananas comosus]
MAAEGAAAARNAKESLELAFQMSEILGAGLDRHTLSLLVALCDRGLNPEALAALVRELSPPPSSSASASAAASEKSALRSDPSPLLLSILYVRDLRF